MKTAVEAIFVGKARQYNRRFLQMCSHHLIEPVACTPASGWEKGQVENQVGNLRDQLFRPKPRVKSLVELNAWLEDQCIAYARRIIKGGHDAARRCLFHDFARGRCHPHAQELTGPPIFSGNVASNSSEHSTITSPFIWPKWPCRGRFKRAPRSSHCQRQWQARKAT